MNGATLVKSLLKSIQHEAGMSRPAHPPADDPPSRGIDHEGDVDEARPGADIGEIRDPEPVRRRRVEHPVDMIQRAWRRLVLDSCADRLAANDTLQAETDHQAFDRASRNVEPLAQHLAPDLARAINLEVLPEHALDLGLQC